MTCNEFEETGWNAERDASLTEAQRAAAASHATSCSRCAALRDSWEATRLELLRLWEVDVRRDYRARLESRLLGQRLLNAGGDRVRHGTDAVTEYGTMLESG